MPSEMCQEADCLPDLSSSLCPEAGGGWKRAWRSLAVAVTRPGHPARKKENREETLGPYANLDLPAYEAVPLRLHLSYQAARSAGLPSMPHLHC